MLGSPKRALSIGSITSSTSVLTLRQTFPYTAVDCDEVSFDVGDIITSVETNCEDWVVGTVIRTGERGMVPREYIQNASLANTPAVEVTGEGGLVRTTGRTS